MCTLGGVDCKDKLFEDRDSWFDHELKSHRALYCCPLCATNGASLAPKELREQILNTHAQFNDEQLQRLQDASRDAAPTFKAQDCPFCDDWANTLRSRNIPNRNEIASDWDYADVSVSSKRFKRHVATY